MPDSYQFKPEAMWKTDPEVEAARKLPGWREFHAACAKSLLFFDHIEKHGRQFVAIAVIGSGPAHKAAEERAKTPIEALVSAFRAAGLPVPAAEPWVAMLLAGPPEEIYDMEDLLG